MVLLRSPAVLVRPDLLATFFRFPASIAAAALGTGLFILRSNDVVPDGDPYFQALYGAAATFLAGVAFSLALDGRSRRAAIIGQGAAIGIGAVAGLALYRLWLSPQLFLAALSLMVVAAPGAASSRSLVGFWNHNLRSGSAALIGGLGTMVALLGASAIIWTVNSLFDLSIPERVHN